MEHKDAVAKLAEGMRAAYELRASGVPDKDAAAKLGLSVGSYQKRVSRAHASVKAAMAQPATDTPTAPETETPAPDAATVSKVTALPGAANVLGLASAITGLSTTELVDAAIDPAKQPEALRKIAENAREEMQGTVIQTDASATVNPGDPASVAVALGDKKKPGRKPMQGTNFDVDKAVELYMAGTKVTDIAVAMGYPKNHGQNRVRMALMAKGVYGKLPTAPAKPEEKK
jgi:hypothetical protein